MNNMDQPEGIMTFVMGNTPNKAFGADPANRPKTAE